MMINLDICNNLTFLLESRQIKEKGSKMKCNSLPLHSDPHFVAIGRRRALPDGLTLLNDDLVLLFHHQGPLAL